jgi:hypothetical protein
VRCSWAATSLSNAPLNATGGVSGTFNPLVNVNVPNFSASLSYDAKDVYLNFAYNPPTGDGFNINQKNVANLLNNFFNANGGIPLALATASPPPPGSPRSRGNWRPARSRPPSMR